MYTISEFRENIRKAFNDAEEGHQVVIERYGQKYQLISLVDKPIGNMSFESVPNKIVIEPAVLIKSPPRPRAQEDVQKMGIGVQRSLNGICKIHKTPLDDRGKCLQKGCKYA